MQLGQYQCRLPHAFPLLVHLSLSYEGPCCAHSVLKPLCSDCLQQCQLVPNEMKSLIRKLVHWDLNRGEYGNDAVREAPGDRLGVQANSCIFISCSLTQAVVDATGDPLGHCCSHLCVLILLSVWVVIGLLVI